MDKDLVSAATHITCDLIQKRAADAPPLDECAVAELFLTAYRGLAIAQKVIAEDEAREAEATVKAAEIAATKAEEDAAAAWIAAGGILGQANPPV
ncbi:MAG: hypothetical protein V4505_19195 [Pseudomonadota bacterium]